MKRWLVRRTTALHSPHTAVERERGRETERELKVGERGVVDVKRERGDES